MPKVTFVNQKKTVEVPEGANLRQLAAIGELGDREALLGTITAPTLVIHGSKDSLIDPSGGRRTAELIPGATYLEIEGMGHDIPQIHWPEIVSAIVAVAATSGLRSMNSGSLPLQLSL